MTGSLSIKIVPCVASEIKPWKKFISIVKQGGTNYMCVIQTGVWVNKEQGEIEAVCLEVNGRPFVVSDNEDRVRVFSLEALGCTRGFVWKNTGVRTFPHTQAYYEVLTALFRQEEPRFWEAFFLYPDAQCEAQKIISTQSTGSENGPVSGPDRIADALGLRDRSSGVRDTTALGRLF